MIQIKFLFGKLSELGWVGLEDERIFLEYPNPKIQLTLIQKKSVKSAQSFKSVILTIILFGKLSELGCVGLEDDRFI